MGMIKFSFEKFLFDKRLTIQELADALKYEYTSVYIMVRRGTCKLSFIRDIEKKFGDCTLYLSKQKLSKVV